MDSTHTPNFGSRLKAKREATHLSLQQVSTHLKLSLTILSQLESCTPGELPPTFMKGYLKQYARYLEFSTDDIAEFLNSFPSPSSPTKKSPAKLAYPIHSSVSSQRKTPWASLFGVLFTIGLVALSAIWWYNPSHISFPDVALVMKPKSQPDLAGVLFSTVQSLQQPTIGYTPIPTPQATVTAKQGPVLKTTSQQSTEPTDQGDDEDERDDE